MFFHVESLLALSEKWPKQWIKNKFAIKD